MVVKVWGWGAMQLRMSSLQIYRRKLTVTNTYVFLYSLLLFYRLDYISTCGTGVRTNVLIPLSRYNHCCIVQCCAKVERLYYTSTYEKRNV